MGCVGTITADRFPAQSVHLMQRVDVCFHYDTTRLVPGILVRDDIEKPFETIIQLGDGRFLRGVECQYTFEAREG
jgi:hypothetical protein